LIVPSAFSSVTARGYAAFLSTFDDARHRVVVLQSSSKEPLCSRRIAPIRQQKVDGLPGGIDRSVKEAISSFDVDVGFIQPPASVGALQKRSGAPIYFRTVDLDPAPDTTCRNCQSSLGSHLGHVRERDRVSQVPPDAPKE
jgi:hypothetical protein